MSHVLISEMAVMHVCINNRNRSCVTDSPLLLDCIKSPACACPAASVMSMTKCYWQHLVLKLTGMTGDEHAINGEAAHDDQPKSKGSRSLKTPLQKEALEAAYSSQFHLNILLSQYL